MAEIQVWRKLHFTISIHDSNFYIGLNHIKSIRRMMFYEIDLRDWQMFHMVAPFLKNNHSLTDFQVYDCELGAEGIRMLSLALGGCNNKMKQIRLSGNQVEDGQMVDVILALSMHPQLEKLDLIRNVGRNECTALATLLRNTTQQLQTLNLWKQYR